MGVRSIESIAGASQEQAEDKGTTTRRLLSELRPHGRRLVLILVLVVVAAAAQAGGPWLIGRAIDLYILRGDVDGLAWTMLLLLGVYLI